MARLPHPGDDSRDCRAAQSALGNVAGKGEAMITIGEHHNTNLLLRVDHHQASKAGGLAVLPQRIAILAVLDTWPQTPAHIPTSRHLWGAHLRCKFCVQVLRLRHLDQKRGQIGSRGSQRTNRTRL